MRWNTMLQPSGGGGFCRGWDVDNNWTPTHHEVICMPQPCITRYKEFNCHDGMQPKFNIQNTVVIVVVVNSDVW